MKTIKIMKAVCIIMALAAVVIVVVAVTGSGYNIEQEAIYQIRNSDSVRVNRTEYPYLGYKGTFTDTYGRLYEFNTTQEIGGLFTEIDTVYSCVIKPKHKAPEVVLESRRYQKEFFNYVEHTYKWYK